MAIVEEDSALDMIGVNVSVRSAFALWESILMPHDLTCCRFMLQKQVGGGGLGV